jgi:hypothetical protein
LDYQDLLTTIEGSDQTVLGLASSTDDAAQKFQVLKNQVIAAAIPLGTQLFEAINDLTPTISKFVGYLATGIKWFAGLPQPIKTTVFVIVALAAALGPVLVVIGMILPALSAFAAILPILGAALGIILSPIGLIVLAVVGLYLAWKTNLFGFRDITQNVIGAVVGFFSDLVGWFTGGGLSGIVDTFSGLVESLIQYGIDFVTWYLTLPIQIGEIFLDLIKRAGSFVSDFLGKFSDLPGKLLAPFSGLFNGFFNIGYNIIAGLLAGIGALWQKFTDTIDNITGKVGDIAGKLKIWSPSRVTMGYGKNIVAGLIEGAKDLVPELERTMGDVADAATPQPGAAAFRADATGAAGMGGGLAITFAQGSIVVNGSDDPEEVANRVGDRVVGRILTAYDRMQTVGAG